MQEIKFGRFHYNLPINNDDAKSYQRSSGCISLNEAYEGKGFVLESEFFLAAKELHRQMPEIRKVMIDNKIEEKNINFVINELLEIKYWLNAQKTQRL